MLGEEVNDLPAGLQDPHIGIEVEPTHALNVQRHMPIKHLTGRHHTCHRHHHPGHPCCGDDEPANQLYARITGKLAGQRRSLTGTATALSARSCSGIMAAWWWISSRLSWTGCMSGSGAGSRG